MSLKIQEILLKIIQTSQNEEWTQREREREREREGPEKQKLHTPADNQNLEDEPQIYASKEPMWK